VIYDLEGLRLLARQAPGLLEEGDFLKIGINVINDIVATAPKRFALRK
jgi:hypothetical protein